MHSSRMCTAHSLPYWGVSLTDTPDRDPPGSETPWTETPQPGQRPPNLDRDPQPLDRDLPPDRAPGQRPPWSCGLWCMPGQRPPPVNRMTHRCKNITLPQLRCVW